MSEFMKLYLFGDQTFDIRNQLSSLLHSHQDPLVTKFFERSIYRLKNEIHSLPEPQKRLFPYFSTLQDLLALRSQKLFNPALQQFLTCVTQIGTFIDMHIANDIPYPTSKDTSLVGICTGSLAAAAVSSSKSLSSLVVAGADVVIIAFRTGLLSWDMGRLLEASEDAFEEPWALTVSGISLGDATQAIDEFCSRIVVPRPVRPYVSAHVSSGHVTIAGIPRILKELKECAELSRFSKSWLSVNGPYHAPHLFTRRGIENILNFDFGPSADSAICEILITCSITGDLLVGKTLPLTLEAVLDMILCTRLNVLSLVDGITSQALKLGLHSLRIYPVATNGAKSLATTLGTSLKDGNVTVELCHDLTTSVPAPTEAMMSNSKIAIIGISGRFPSANGMEEFWSLLRQGLDVHKTVPPSRWSSKTHVDNGASPKKNTSGTGFGCWLDDAAWFDAHFFNMSPREAPQVDPAQRIALMTAHEAFENAGIVPGRTPSTQKDRFGVWFGCTSNDWMETNSPQNIDTYFIPGGNRAFIPGRINYHYKLSGPSFTIDTACSSSLTALHMACNALWRGEVDTAISGGTNVLTNPDMTAGLDRGHFLSRTGNCKTFDEDADGYCRGEGVATLILKRLEDAIADNDPILAVIPSRGIATNHNADAESITRPHIGAQKELFTKVLGSTNISPDEISYVELHGTGTQAGDASETNSVLETFASDDPSKRRANPLYIGAVKASVGHGEAAAGVTSIAKILSMLKHSTIPPHCGIKSRMNSRIPALDVRNVHIATQPIPWPQRAHGDGTRKVFLNNFSAAGGNTAMVIEDAPEQIYCEEPDVRTSHVVAASAKSPVSLEGNLKALLHWIEHLSCQDGTLALARLSYTTTARRTHHPHRVAIVGSSLMDIKDGVKDALAKRSGMTRMKTPLQIIYSFTGNGGQYPKMGNDYIKAFPTFRKHIEQYDQLCQSHGFPSIMSYYTDDPHETDTTVLQLASVCLQTALFRLWTAWGAQPKVLIGHSLGHYAALNASGMLSDSDTIYLVGTRAELLKNLCTKGSHAMLAVRAKIEDIRDTLEKSRAAEVSCINGTDEIVLGGPKNSLQGVNSDLKSRGIRTTFLEVPFAFHTSQVDPILSELDSAARRVTLRDASIPVLCSLDGIVLKKAADLPDDYFSRHCREPVNLINALDSAKPILGGQSIAIEMGPAPIVCKLVKRNLGEECSAASSLQKGQLPWKCVSETLAMLYNSGTSIAWDVYHREFKSAQKVLELPRYSWDLKEYWIPYVHDWSLRKGDPPLIERGASLLSTCIHKVLEESVSKSGGETELLLESDLSRKDLHPMVQGHQVYGVPLCTPSVYADIALCVGRYLKDGRSVSKDAGIAVGPMEIKAALVAKDDGTPQLLRTSVTFNPQTKAAVCRFRSVDVNGKTTEEHSTCHITFFDTEVRKREIESQFSHSRARMAEIHANVSDHENTYKFSKSMIYKMIGKLADFDPKYRGLSEIHLDNRSMEASGKVSFKDIPTDGQFHTNPAYIDSLSQLGGFVMNANETVDLEKEVFVNHGWDNLQLFEVIDADKTYFTHVKMSETGGGLWKGDLIIHDSENVVGIFEGVALQNVPKRLMHYIVTAAQKRNVSRSSNSNPTNKQPVPVPEQRKALGGTQAPARHPQAPARHPQAAINTPRISNSSGGIGPLAAVIRIMSEESGLAVEDLTEESALADLGVDSLLALVICSRWREELDIDVESSEFLTFETVKDLQDALLRSGKISTDDQAKVHAAQTRPPIPATQPVLHHNAQLHKNITESSSIWPDALTIIAQESGLGQGDLSDDTVLADCGIDSLLSLVICSRFRNELNLDIENDGSLILNNPTIKDLETRITGYQTSGSSDTSSTSISNEDEHVFLETPATGSLTPENRAEPVRSLKTTARNDPLLVEPRELHKVWSMILQGVPRTAEKILFLFPDGAGSASSYASLPKISPSLSVIGFNSPFMRRPHDMSSCDLSTLISSYVEHIRGRQPHGPYHLGGWSAGGILAYAAAYKLLASGEQVHNLVLIDSPPPTRGLDHLPQRFYDHCESVRLFGNEMSNLADGKRARAPEWLMPHFRATISMLSNYIALPMPEGARQPKAHVIWAGDCALDGKHYPRMPDRPENAEFDPLDQDTEGMKFLTEERKDYGPAAWVELFPGQTISTSVVEGEHHFSMMRSKGAEKLSSFIKKSLEL